MALSIIKEFFIPFYIGKTGNLFNPESRGIKVEFHSSADVAIIPGATDSKYEGDAFIVGIDTEPKLFSSNWPKDTDANTLYVGTNNFNPADAPAGYDEIVFMPTVDSAKCYDIDHTSFTDTFIKEILIPGYTTYSEGIFDRYVVGSDIRFNGFYDVAIIEGNGKPYEHDTFAVGMDTPRDLLMGDWHYHDQNVLHVGTSHITPNDIPTYIDEVIFDPPINIPTSFQMSTSTATPTAIPSDTLETQNGILDTQESINELEQTSQELGEQLADIESALQDQSGIMETADELANISAELQSQVSDPWMSGAISDAAPQITQATSPFSVMAPMAAITFIAGWTLLNQAANNKRFEAAGYGIKLSTPQAMKSVIKQGVAKQTGKAKLFMHKLADKIHSR